MKNTHHVPSFRYAVVGAGAVGLYYGTKLAWRGRDVRFLLRSGLADAKRFGIRVRSREGDCSVRGRDFYERPEAIGSVDVVFVALPAGDDALAHRLLAPLMGPGTFVLSLHAGFGDDGGLAAALASDRILAGIATVATERIGPAEVRHFGGGQLTVADTARFPRPILHDLASEFRRCGVPFRPVWRLERARWEQAAWDVAVRGVCILAGRTPLDLLVHTPALCRDVGDLADEVARIAASVGHPLRPALGAALLDRARSLGAYRPPPLLWPDGTHELEAIWGNAWRRAGALGVSAPALERMYDALRRRVAAGM